MENLQNPYWAGGSAIASLTLWLENTWKILHHPIFFLRYSFNENPKKIQLSAGALAIQLWIVPRDSFEHILPNRFGIKDLGLKVVTKYCAKASPSDVFLCNIGKSLRTILFFAPTMAEEEPVAIPQILKLLRDDAGK